LMDSSILWLSPSPHALAMMTCTEISEAWRAAPWRKASEAERPTLLTSRRPVERCAKLSKEESTPSWPPSWADLSEDDEGLSEECFQLVVKASFLEFVADSPQLRRTKSDSVLRCEVSPRLQSSIPAKSSWPGEQLSEGSKLHGVGCQPCAWFWKGCQRGSSCRHCHLCPEGELRKRKKEKQKTQKLLSTPEQPSQTTLMLKNLPNNYTRSMLLALLDKEGFACLYDFIYLPFDFTRNANRGYAFVNFAQAKSIAPFWEAFHGFKRWSLPSAKVCEVTWSSGCQGLQAHIDRYRNSSVMHESVPEKYRPLIFQAGQRVAFPSPTVELQIPHGAE